MKWEEHWWGKKKEVGEVRGEMGEVSGRWGKWERMRTATQQ